MNIQELQNKQTRKESWKHIEKIPTSSRILPSAVFSLEGIWFDCVDLMALLYILDLPKVHPTNPPTNHSLTHLSKPSWLKWAKGAEELAWRWDCWATLINTMLVLPEIKFFPRSIFANQSDGKEGQNFPWFLGSMIVQQRRRRSTLAVRIKTESLKLVNTFISALECIILQYTKLN